MICASAFAVVLLAGCGGNDKSAAEAKADYCGDLSALQSSVDTLEQTLNNPGATLDQVKDARDDVHKQVQAVDDSADDVADANVDQLDEAYDALNKAINDIEDSATLAEAQQGIADEVQGVRTAWQEVLSTADCP